MQFNHDTHFGNGVTIVGGINDRFENITKNFDVPTGGITFTLLLNLVVCTTMFLVFVCCLQPFIPLFNVNRKRKLVQRVKNEMGVHFLQKQQQQQQQKSKKQEDRDEKTLKETDSTTEGTYRTGARRGRSDSVVSHLFQANGDIENEPGNCRNDVVTTTTTMTAATHARELDSGYHQNTIDNSSRAEYDGDDDGGGSEYGANHEVMEEKSNLITCVMDENSGYSDSYHHNNNRNRSEISEELDDDDDDDITDQTNTNCMIENSDDCDNRSHFENDSAEFAVNEGSLQNLLDLNETEVDETQRDDQSQTAIRFYERFSIFSLVKKLNRSMVVLRELLVYIWSVFLSFFNSKHNIEDMKHLYTRYSRDVATYLLFQKEIILALSLCSFLAACILLPIHLTGVEPVYESYNFGSYNLTQDDYPLLRTSVSMVITSPHKLYAHVILCIVFLLIFAMFLHRFRTSEVVAREHFLEEQQFLESRKRGSLQMKLKLKPTQLVSKYSVKLYGLKSTFQSQRAFDRMVREELCPDLKVFKTVLMFNVTERLKLQKEYKSYCDKVERYMYLEEHKDKNPTIRPFSLRHGFSERVDAVEYYRNKMLETEEKMKDWEARYHRVLNDETGDERAETITSLGFGFVVFETPEDATECLSRFYKRGRVKKTIVSNNGEQSQLYFSVTSAYEPDDINWNNMLNYTGYFDSVRNWLIQISIVIIFIFMTTPLAALSGVQSFANLPSVSESIEKIRKTTGHAGSLLFQYLPTFMLHTLAICLPYVVWIIADFAKYRSKSRYNRKLMSRMYVYLVLSTLLMPSMALTSFDAVITYFRSRENLRNMFSKMFLPASGAFFLNYVLQQVFMKNFGDLIRIFNLLKYFWGVRHWPAVSPKDVLRACELSEFYFEYEYPYMISVLCMVLCYSLLSPLILFFGLAYMILKHLVDRYVIMYIYGHKTGGARGVLSFDFRAHRKNVNLVIQLMIVNMIVFAVAMTIFFATRVRADSDLYPHAVIIGLVMGAVFIVFFIEYMNSVSVIEFLKKKLSKLVSNRSQSGEETSQVAVDEESARIVTTTVGKSYGSISVKSIFKDPKFIKAYEPPFRYTSRTKFKFWSEMSIAQHYSD